MKIVTLLFFTLSFLFSNSVFSADRFWVGGTGNWSNTAKWSLTSGGAGGASVPLSPDNVFIDNGSGLLGVADTVFIDGSAEMNNFDLSGITNSFTISSTQPSIQIFGSILGNGAGINFDWFNGSIIMRPVLAETIVSNAVVWSQSFVIDSIGSVSLLDNLSIGLNDLIIKAGSFSASGNTISCGNFISNSISTRSVDLTSSIINCSDSLWQVDSTNFTWISVNSIININSSIDTFLFIGGHLIYDTINSSTPLLQFYDNNTIDIFTTLNGFQINNSDTLTVNSLNINASCLSLKTISSIDSLGASSFIESSPALSLQYVRINNVDGATPFNYTLIASDTLNGADNWSFLGQDFYWIGGTGNWSDTSNWSLVSGGANASCLPDVNDNVFFDANSGLAALSDTVYFDLSFTIQGFNFVAVPNPFTFGGNVLSVEIQGDLMANGVADFVWGGTINLTPNSLSTVSSIGQAFANDFNINTADTVLFMDDFLTSKNISLEQGVLSTQKINVECFNFLSSFTNNRTLVMDSAVYNVNGTLWDVDSTSFNLINVPSTILFNNVDTAIINGGFQVYDSINAFTTEIQFFDDNSIRFLNLGNSNLGLENTSLQTIDSLVTSNNCASRTNIHSIDPLLGSATIKKNGYLIFNGFGLSINNVDAIQTTTETYNISSSDTTNGANGWTLKGNNFYWINNSGNWSDTNNWSFTSGGAPAGCTPTKLDSVYFDNLSFSFAGQVVTVDSLAEFSLMDWSASLNNPTLTLDTNIISYGDVTLNSNLTVLQTLSTRKFEFAQQASFDPDTCSFNTNLSVYMKTASDSLSLLSSLNMADTNAIYLISGEFFSMNNDITTGTFIVLTLVGVPTLDSLKHLDLGSSTIFLNNSFNSDNSSANFTFDAGTSNITIGNSNQVNALITEGLTFYDVKLDFQKTANSQIISGNNSFNKLEITKGSYVVFDSLSIQTVADSLILKGDCKDSIYLSSSNAAQPAIINKTDNTTLVAEVLDLTSINATGSTLTTLFSTDNGSNTGWVFDTAPPVTAAFNSTGPFCFGDTTQLVNTSTGYTGGAANISSIWYFNDGSTGYYANPPTDSTFITYVSDTNQHVFEQSGDIGVVLVSTYSNFCTDTVNVNIHINKPSVILTTSPGDTTICLGEEVSFEASSLISGASFEFFLNGVSQNTPSPNDTLLVTSSLVNNDTISVLSYENGCVSDTMPMLIFRVDSLPVISWFSSDADTSICLNDSVTFTTSGTGKYRYYINNVGVTGTTTSGIFSTNSLANNDTIYVIGTDTVTNCTNTLPSMIFTVNPLPTTTLATTIAANNFCAETSVTFTASGANTYEFFINGTSQGAASATTTFTTTTLTTGDTVSVTGYSVQGCSLTAPETYTYQVNPLPIVTLSFNDVDTSICSNDNVIFTASGASLYEFFINGTSQGASSSVNTLSTTTLANNDSIYVIGTFSGCSGYSDTAIFEVLASPTTTLVSNDADSTICDQTEVVFTAAGATSYEFFIDGISQGATSAIDTFTTSSLTNGQIISVIGTSNTCQVSQGIPFTVLAVPNVPLFSSDADNAICQGENITFTSANAATYELFVNSLSQGAPQVSSSFTLTLSPGVDTVIVVGISANTCTDTSSMIIINVTATPVVTLTSSDTDDIICENESVTFTGAGSSQFQFLINGVSQGSLSATNTFTTTNLQNGDIISITGSTNGCTATSNSITMTVNANPTVTLSSSDADNIFCTGDLVTFTSGGATNYEFLVDGVSQGASSPTNSITSAGFISGAYPIVVIGDSSNCFNQTSMNVVVNDVPTASITSSIVNDTICQGASITYSAAGGVTYEFFVNSVSQGTASALSTFTSSSLVDGDSVGVLVTSSSFCTGVAGANSITVLPLPTVALTSSDVDTTICSGDMVTFTGSGATNYEFFINGVSQGPSSPLATFSTTSIANIDSIGVVGELNGCISTSNGFTFSVNNAPLVLFTNSGANSICTGENTNMTATGANNYEFFVNGLSAGPSSPTNTFTSPLNNGDVVTVIGESNGCTSLSSSSYTFTVFTFPTLTTTSSDADDIICLGEQVDFTASGAMTYTYELNGAIIQNGTTSTYGLNSLLNGDVITITGYNGNCASTSSIYTFTVNSMNLDLAVSPSSMICDGDAVTFTGSGADQYEFFLNGVSTGAVSATNTYTSSVLTNLDEVTFTGYNNTTLCSQDFEGSIIMNVINTPSITALSSTTFCDGDSVQLQSNASYGNQWVLDGTPITGATDTLYTALIGGNYTLETTSGGIGTLWSFGQNATGTFANGNNFNNSEPTPADNTVMFDELSSGSDFILAVSTTGDAYSWGENSSGQLGDGTYTNTNLPNLVPTLTGVKTIATSESSSMAVLTSGDVYVWGNNTEGQLGTGNTAVINFPFLNTAIANTDSIAGGKSHFVILRNDGTVWSVGNNDFGQLGQGNLTSSNAAVQVAGLSGIVSVGAGEYHSFAIDNLGDLYTWGNNGSGQLGLSDISNRLSPTLSPMKNVVNAQGGANHSVFLTSNQKVYTTGGNAYGQLGTGSLTSSEEPTLVNISGADMISAGQYTTLVKRTDNSVFGFGNNAEDQLSSNSGNLVNTPEHISDLNGVGFIEAGKLASHILSQEEKQCASTATVVTVNAVPLVTITVNADLLTTIAGASYQWYLDGLIIPGAINQTLTATATGNYSVEVTFANGCTGLSADAFVSFVGLEDLEFGSVKLYPNPTNGILNIRLTDELLGLSAVSVLDQSGRIVQTNEVNSLQNYSLNVQSIENGVYYIRIENEGRKLILKFVKSNN